MLVILHNGSSINDNTTSVRIVKKITGGRGLANMGRGAEGVGFEEGCPPLQ